MVSKWEQFKKDFNAGYEQPINLKGLSKTTENNIVKDWSRAGDDPTLIPKVPATLGVTVLINGISIHELIQKDKGLDITPAPLFDNMDQLDAFFEKNLLRDITSDKKALMLVQMRELLHQGALQTPVTTAASMFVLEKSNNEVIACNALFYQVNDERIMGQTREVSFNSTPTGFTVHEISTQHMMVDKEGDYIFPDDPTNKPYIYKAEATVNIDFSQNPSEPTISIEKNTIDYGSKQIENLLDGRNFLQKFIDGILVALGFKTIEKVVATKEAAAKNANEQPANPVGGGASTPRL